MVFGVPAAGAQAGRPRTAPPPARCVAPGARHPRNPIFERRSVCVRRRLPRVRRPAAAFSRPAPRLLRRPLQRLDGLVPVCVLGCVRGAPPAGSPPPLQTPHKHCGTASPFARAPARLPASTRLGRLSAMPDICRKALPLRPHMIRLSFWAAPCLAAASRAAQARVGRQPPAWAPGVGRWQQLPAHHDALGAAMGQEMPCSSGTHAALAAAGEARGRPGRGGQQRVGGSCRPGVSGDRTACCRAKHPLPDRSVRPWRPPAVRAATRCGCTGLRTGLRRRPRRAS